MKLHTLRAALALATFSPLMAHASLVNGSFSSGLSGWSSLGDVVSAGGIASLTTASLYIDDASGVPAAFNLSGTGAAPVGVAGGVEDFAGLALGALDPDPANAVVAYEGSVLKQTLTVAAGDSLSFDWSFASQEDPATGMNDYAFVVIDGQLSRLADVLGATGSGHYSQTFASAASFELVFGVVDVGDFNGTSLLGLGNVSLTSPANNVPEPGSLALALAGLGFVARLRRR